MAVGKLKSAACADLRDPFADMSPTQAITAMRDPDAVLEIARHVSAAIPDHSEATEELLNSYQHSPYSGSIQAHFPGPIPCVHSCAPSRIWRVGASSYLVSADLLTIRSSGAAGHFL